MFLLGKHRLKFWASLQSARSTQGETDPESPEGQRAFLDEVNR